MYRWRATFTAKFIEEITHRTGNFKPFSVFVKMLGSAFDLDSPSVSLDLLTSEDLEALRQASGVNTGHRPAAQSSGVHSKRYLILTYQSEFDKVHYPMALSYCEVDDVGELKRTIVRLRDELESLKRSHMDPSCVHELEGLVMTYKSEKEQLGRDLNQYSMENNKLVDLVESLKSDNHLLRMRIERLESDARQRGSSRIPNNTSSILTSPANSLRTLRPPPTSVRAPSPTRSQRGLSPRTAPSRPPTAPARRVTSTTSPRSVKGYTSPYAQSSLRSPASSTRSVEVPSPNRRRNTAPALHAISRSPIRPPALPIAPVASLSEVDARLQALQNFLRHQKQNRV